ncbi:uncharacterized protein N7496_001568 [Penicillium cataractarum]|uniref:Killer toxin Kp4 domain-containing protein n=1 Tax=Penicillium cataractarum TaxID=2100454 RepID=A0A9X0B723_9EURO|nr:uncharacterized protein N7496_001568 [Penicillium cataractarum]KAJ5390500.1 hypothetical protein N7496_001568 [Penicillium cataractarum]
MVRLLSLGLVVVSAFTSANALGINCRGSSSCPYIQKGADTAQELANYLSGVYDHQWYDNGQYIACVEGPATDAPSVPNYTVCAFFQNSGGGDGARVKELAGLIPGHGCKTCGAVPYWAPEGNKNVNDGELRYDGFGFEDPRSVCPGYPGLC